MKKVGGLAGVWVRGCRPELDFLTTNLKLFLNFLATRKATLQPANPTIL